MGAEVAVPVLGVVMPPARLGPTPVRSRPAAPAGGVARRSGQATVGALPTERPLMELVARAKDGSPDAWESLYRRAYPNLIRYVRRRVTAQADAGDVVSETFARAFHGIGQFTWKGAGFDAWLYGICRNVIREGQRVDRRRDREMACAERGWDEPLEYVLHNEEAVALRAALATLGSADRELLELRVVAGLSSEEVGAVLGKRPAAVRMAQSRALARLRAALEEGHPDQDRRPGEALHAHSGINGGPRVPPSSTTNGRDGSGVSRCP